MKKLVLLLLFLAFSFSHLSAGWEVRRDTSAALSGRLFILGVGINDDGISMMQLENCENDTRMVVEHIISLYKSHPKCDEKFNDFNSSITSNVLTGEMASDENIKAIYESYALKSKPDDYFFFVFNGMTELLPQGDDKERVEETHFFFYRSIIPVSTLARWLELIPCNNQMIITEAGYGKSFTYELIAALSPKEYAFIVDNPRNRVVVTTSGVGFDDFQCNGAMVGHGPLNWFLLNSNYIFSTFFKEQKTSCLDSKRIKYALCDTCLLEFDLAKTEMECNFRSTYTMGELYAKITYEKELLGFLSKYLMNSQSRGVQTLSYADQATVLEDQPKQHALVIGINEYDGKGSWQDLRNPLNDAKSVANILETNYGYTTSLLQNATKNEILDELLRIRGIVGEKDNFLFFIAGHGYYDVEYSDGYIVAKDTKSLEDDKHKSSYIDFASLQKLIGNMRANNIFLIFDVCFGGTFGSTYEDLSYTSYDKEISDISIGTLAMRKTENGYKSRIYLASGDKEVPDHWNNSSNHSPFADKLIKILSSDEAYLTPGYIYKKLELNITEPVFKAFTDHDVKGEFFLIQTASKTR